MHTHTKIRGIAPGLHLQMPKRVFCHQYNADFWSLAPILSIFEIKDVNRCAHA